MGDPGRTGPQGFPGPKGPEGPAGDKGPKGPVGDKGIVGETGPEGNIGVTGEAGIDGTEGMTGDEGFPGMTGEQGPEGEDGDLGPQGDNGEIGDQGFTGPAGPAGGLLCYAYVFNNASQQVNTSSPIVFTQNGTISPGIIFSPPNDYVTVDLTGNYMISFSVTTVGESATAGNQISIVVDGVATFGHTFGTGANGGHNEGRVITKVSAGQKVGISNLYSNGQLTLGTTTGGTQQVTNAAMIIERVA
jgi:hypothetical protein